MANPRHLAKLNEGLDAWHKWRREQKVLGPLTPEEVAELMPDLSGGDLSGRDLSGANLSHVNLERANLARARLYGTKLNGANLAYAGLPDAELYKAKLCRANLCYANLAQATLREANLTQADLVEAYLDGVDLTGARLNAANLRKANLSGATLSHAALCDADLCKADLSGADLSHADLSLADLSRATLVKTNLEWANLTAARVYGISAWDVKLEGAIQANLKITPRGEPEIEVENLEVAQFIYLLLNNQKIRGVIDTITSKVVLILGNFKAERKEVLDAIWDELRKRGYSPVLFDFSGPASRDLTETISTLAHMARFVIADITDARSVPQELQAIVPHLPSVPVQPLLLASQREYAMFEHFRRYPWVLATVLYEDQNSLVAEIGERVIAPAEAKVKELRGGGGP